MNTKSFVERKLGEFEKQFAIGKGRKWILTEEESGELKSFINSALKEAIEEGKYQATKDWKRILKVGNEREEIIADLKVIKRLKATKMKEEIKTDWKEKFVKMWDSLPDDPNPARFHIIKDFISNLLISEKKKEQKISAKELFETKRIYINEMDAQLKAQKKKIVEEIDKIMELEPDWVKLKRKLLK